MKDMISTRNLNLWYGANHALKDVNLTLSEKEITALIGPSGCGKSTYLKTLNRMNDLVEGCRIEGEVTLAAVRLAKVEGGRRDGARPGRHAYGQGQ